MKTRLYLPLLSLSLLLLLPACAKIDARTNVQQSAQAGETAAAVSAAEELSLSQIAGETDLAFVGTYTGEFEIYGMGNGEINLSGFPIDDTDYYARVSYTVERVLRGDPTLEGTTVVVEEYLGYSDEAAEEPTAAGREGTKFVILAYEMDEGGYHVPVSTPGYFLETDGETVTFPGSVSGGGDIQTVDDLAAYLESS